MIAADAMTYNIGRPTLHNLKRHPSFIDEDENPCLVNETATPFCEITDFTAVNTIVEMLHLLNFLEKNPGGNYTAFIESNGKEGLYDPLQFFYKCDLEENVCATNLQSRKNETRVPHKPRRTPPIGTHYKHKQKNFADLDKVSNTKSVCATQIKNLCRPNFGKVQRTASIVKAGAVLHTLRHGRDITPRKIAHIMSNNDGDRESNSTVNVIIESGEETEKSYSLSKPFHHKQSHDNVIKRKEKKLHTIDIEDEEQFQPFSYMCNTKAEKCKEAKEITDPNNCVVHNVSNIEIVHLLDFMGQYPGKDYVAFGENIRRKNGNNNNEMISSTLNHIEHCINEEICEKNWSNSSEARILPLISRRKYPIKAATDIKRKLLANLDSSDTRNDCATLRNVPSHPKFKLFQRTSSVRKVEAALEIMHSGRDEIDHITQDVTSNNDEKGSISLLWQNNDIRQRELNLFSEGTYSDNSSSAHHGLNVDEYMGMKDQKLHRTNKKVNGISQNVLFVHNSEREGTNSLVESSTTSIVDFHNASNIEILELLHFLEHNPEGDYVAFRKKMREEKYAIEDEIDHSPLDRNDNKHDVAFRLRYHPASKKNDSLKRKRVADLDKSNSFTDSSRVNMFQMMQMKRQSPESVAINMEKTAVQEKSAGSFLSHCRNIGDYSKTIVSTENCCKLFSEKNANVFQDLTSSGSKSMKGGHLGNSSHYAQVDKNVNLCEDKSTSSDALPLTHENCSKEKIISENNLAFGLVWVKTRNNETSPAYIISKSSEKNERGENMATIQWASDDVIETVEMKRIEFELPKKRRRKLVMTAVDVAVPRDSVKVTLVGVGISQQKQLWIPRLHVKRNSTKVGDAKNIKISLPLCNEDRNDESSVRRLSSSNEPKYILSRNVSLYNKTDTSSCDRTILSKFDTTKIPLPQQKKRKCDDLSPSPNIVQYLKNEHVFAKRISDKRFYRGKICGPSIQNIYQQDKKYCSDRQHHCSQFYKVKFDDGYLEKCLPATYISRTMPQKFGNGTKVYACWLDGIVLRDRFKVREMDNSRSWYPGIIKGYIPEMAMYEVLFNDGDIDKELPYEYIEDADTYLKALSKDNVKKKIKDQFKGCNELSDKDTSVQRISHKKSQIHEFSMRHRIVIPFSDIPQNIKSGDTFQIKLKIRRPEENGCKSSLAKVIEQDRVLFVQCPDRLQSDKMVVYVPECRKEMLEVPELKETKSEFHRKSKIDADQIPVQIPYQ